MTPAQVLDIIFQSVGSTCAIGALIFFVLVWREQRRLAALPFLLPDTYLRWQLENGAVVEGVHADHDEEGVVHLDTDYLWRLEQRIRAGEVKVVGVVLKGSQNVGGTA